MAPNGRDNERTPNDVAGPHTTIKRGPGRPKKIYQTVTGPDDGDNGRPAKRKRGRPRLAFQPATPLSDGALRQGVSGTTKGQIKRIYSERMTADRAGEAPPKRGRGRPKKAIGSPRISKRYIEAQQSSLSSHMSPLPTNAPLSTNAQRVSNTRQEAREPAEPTLRDIFSAIGTLTDRVEALERGLPKRKLAKMGRDHSGQETGIKRRRGRPKKVIEETIPKISAGNGVLIKRGRGRRKKSAS